MAGGYDNLSKDPLESLRRELVEARRRLAELERPTGTQYYAALSELRDLVDNLEERIETVSASGATWQGPVATSGTVRADTMLNSVGAYNNDITATRRGAWWRSNGDAGYASSSIEKKDLLEGITAPDVVRLLEAAAVSTYYQYKAEVDKRDNPENPEYDPEYHVAVEWGGIAEWFHELGLWQVVVYEDHRKPVALHYEMMGLLGIEAARTVWAEFTEYRRATDARLLRIEEALGI